MSRFACLDQVVHSAVRVSLVYERCKLRAGQELLAFAHTLVGW
jgi:hypothetical protein